MSSFLDFASRETLNKRLAYEKEVCATPLGHESWALRQRALTEVRLGREDEAFKLFEQAATLHTEGDPSPAAAMCWYDLAETYMRRRDGVRAANLCSAGELLRRALRSPALEADPHRAAMVRSSLASCLRHMAQEPLFHENADDLLADAAQLFEQAVTIAERGGRIEWESLAQYLHNLGNLEAQRGRLDKAVQRMAQAEAFARGVEHAEGMGGREELLSTILVHSAQNRALRARGEDRDIALKQLAEALRIAHPKWVHMAQLEQAKILLEAPETSREQAVAALRRVHSDELPPHGLHALINLYRRAGLRREALLALHRDIDRAMAARTQTMADHAGAFWAEQAQRAAHLAARLHVEEGEAIEAFITLEHVSGVRFQEVVNTYCRRPKGPVARSVQQRFRQISVAASTIEHCADLLALGQLPSELREHIESTKRAVDSRGFDHGGLDPHALLIDALTNAERQADSAGDLRGRAQRLRQEALRIERCLVRLEPAADPLKDPWAYRPTSELVRDLLRANPGHALVRLSIAEDLLVIAVWLEGDTLVTRSHRVDVPPRLFEHLAHYQDHPDDVPFDAIAADFASLDLSAALPPEPMEHAVLLPSYAASLLPLAAIGPVGRTLLDRFRALSWMPCVAPLISRQSPHPPRFGVVSVAPGLTTHHPMAFRLALPNEERIEGAEATVQRVVDAVRHADVLCFYTHGRHAGPNGPEIDLADQSLNRAWLDARWAGLERVELWACQSGVNIPSDLLTPPVDEIFGMDNDFLHVGARSAIGTLWKVPDFVTACIVRRYRRRLFEGATAPKALTETQRWWRDEGVRALEDKLRRLPFEDALQAFVQKLGAPIAVSDADVEAPDGSAPSTMATSDELEKMLAWLRHPLSWAGFRFVGVAERRPERPWGDDDERPLTRDEEAEVERILAEAKVEVPLQALDDWQEERLGMATTLAPGGHPSPSQAIRVARQYRDRTSSSHLHNLLAALAWLHEALAALSETTSDAEEQRQARDRLALEAAWQWMELARGEVLYRHDLLVGGPAKVPIARARRLLEGLPASPHTRVLRAWLDLLAKDPNSLADLDAAARVAWVHAQSAIEDALTEAESYEGLRTLAESAELLLLAPDALKDEAAELIARVRDRVELNSWPYDVAGCGARLGSALAILRQHLDADDALGLAGPGLLPPRELAREAIEISRQLQQAPPSKGSELHKRANRCFDALEGALWGYPADDRAPLWRSTGTLGAAYRRLSGLWLGMLGRDRGEGTATQIIAGLQPAADLRLTLLSRWAHLTSQPEHPTHYFWLDARDREMLFEALEDAALLPDFERASVAEAPGCVEPHRLDPFRCSSDELQRGCASPLDLVPWVLGEYTRHTPNDGPAAETSAFRAVHESGRLGAIVEDIWKKVLGEAPDLAARFDPTLKLADREAWLRRTPVGAVILGLTIGTAGELIVASVWNRHGILEQRAHATQEPTGARVRHLLAALHQGEPSDQTSERGVSTRRRKLWNELRRAIEPALSSVLGPALDDGPLGVAVFAPGSLRSLPLLGLHVGERPLHERSLGVMHLPSLGGEPVRRGATSDACLLGRERDEGDTSFGEAAVETLRRWFEPRVIRPPREATTNIVEVGQLEPIAPTLHTLRLYGVGNVEAIAPTLAGITIDGRRRLSDRNTRGLLLGRCEVVELWAATAGSGPMSGILQDDRDRIPGLARSFLLCGAAGVIDLAWPVHDLVKALVCERFGILHRTDRMRGPEALGRAVAQTADLLGAWREAASGAANLAEALRRLDDARRAVARDARLREADVIPFDARADAPSIIGRSVVEVIEEACATFHLGAFRFWGWFQG